MVDRRTGAAPVPAAAPTEARLRDAERSENFPVALRVLPAAIRAHLRAVYDVVRVIDDIGDGDTDGPQQDPRPVTAEEAADRTARLHGLCTDLRRVFDDGPGPEAPVLRRLVPTARACGLTREPFERLVAANLADQYVTRYRTWDDLLGYCVLSADPIGRMVLAVFGVGAPPGSDLQRWSDRICTALQILEHCQDVAEDRARGRIYLPVDDLTAFGVDESDLDAPHASPALRALLAEVTGRACALLDEGAPLLGRLHGWARVAVAGYAAGGRAAADALRRSDFDVLAGAPEARRRDVVRHLVRDLTRPSRELEFRKQGTV
ncbi:phytoene synthase [Pseudonocardia sulfidoxydans NBRC 16205]|uniref:Phytoene synthase n=1 Tax=Pseudonocardia sulfidoxydans NBRC 16205 TaxID=1223511 RepID=A0A511DBI3_9PSEU|nr:squalene synthase HpnC [Pseudonocardia sulfidoxydans]GEL21927.1 phytoene synthase [Pseudonocardia sulfidoxydans NBRC 16205]